jgi:hypothetical protein
MRLLRGIGSVVCGLLAFALTGCGNENRNVEAAEGDCVSSVLYKGHIYGWSDVEVAPREGRPLGEAGLYCNLHEAAAGAAPYQEIELAEIEGVAPEIALAWRQHSDMVFVREGLDPLPPEVERLMRVPKCDPRDEPIEFAGPWLGIRGVVYEELDMVPPYDVDLLVEESSAPRYERAFLAVRVPKELGRPLTHTDIRDSLRRGGSVTLSVSCWLDGRYVAERIAAHPPD